MTFRSFTLNLSIILCEYFLKACATMTLISQFKSTFKSNCKAMSYVLACWLPYFIFEHLTRRIKMHSPRAQPAVCQIFKCPGTWRIFRISSTSNERRPPIFRISLCLTYILSHRPTWFTRLSGRSVGLAHSLHSPLGFPQLRNWIPCVRAQDGSHFRQNRGGESFKSVFPWSGSERGAALIFAVVGRQQKECVNFM